MKSRSQKPKIDTKNMSHKPKKKNKTKKQQENKNSICYFLDRKLWITLHSHKQQHIGIDMSIDLTELKTAKSGPLRLKEV